MSEGCTPSKCATCSKKGQCGTSPEQLKMMEEIAARMENIEHKILVLSGKGGVGKSMVSAQLAFALARQGYRVGMLDIDICGPTVPKMLGVRGQGTTKGPNGLLPVRVNENLCAMSIGFVVENFSSFACPLCHGITEVWPCTHGGGLQLAIDHDVPFLGRVPLDPELARVGEKGVELAAMGETATAKALAAISEQVLDSVLPDRKKPVSAKVLAETKTEKSEEEPKKE